VLRQRLHAKARLRHILAFVKVAELGTTHKAAAALGATQPAVTQLLSEFEQLLDAALFLRHARGMSLTAVGRELLPAARRMLLALDDLAEQTAALSNRSSSILRIAATGGALAALVAPMLPSFNAAHPEVLVQVQEVGPTELAALLPRHEVDLGFAREPAVVQAGWQFTPLLDDSFVVVVGPGHPLASRHAVPMEELRAQTWLVLPMDSEARIAFERLFESELPALCQVSGRVMSVMLEMLGAGPLLTLVPHSVVSQMLRAGRLVQLQLDGVTMTSIAPIGMYVPETGMGRAALALHAHLARGPARRT
jgi:DNA-binding transcriptional LysR family regulator